MKKTAKGMMTPSAPRTFVRGVALTPSSQLIAWLDGLSAGGRPPLLRVPLVLTRGPVGFSIRGAKIGNSADAVEVLARDSALGIGLADRALSQCGDAAACAMWVEGRWSGKVEGDLVFEVVRVHAPIAPDLLASANYAEVEDPAK